MTVKKGKQQPGKANSVEVIGEVLSEKDLKGITGGAKRFSQAKPLQEDTNSKDVIPTPAGRA